MYISLTLPEIIDTAAVAYYMTTGLGPVRATLRKNKNKTFLRKVDEFYLTF